MQETRGDAGIKRRGAGGEEERREARVASGETREAAAAAVSLTGSLSQQLIAALASCLRQVLEPRMRDAAGAHCLSAAASRSPDRPLRLSGQRGLHESDEAIASRKGGSLEERSRQ